MLLRGRIALQQSIACTYGMHLNLLTPHVHVQNLKESVVQLLDAFYAKNQTTPEKVIVFRDGVSEGELPVVQSREIPQVIAWPQLSALRLCLHGQGSLCQLPSTLAESHAEHRPRCISSCSFGDNSACLGAPQPFQEASDQGTAACTLLSSMLTAH